MAAPTRIALSLLLTGSLLGCQPATTAPDVSRGGRADMAVADGFAIKGQLDLTNGVKADGMKTKQVLSAVVDSILAGMAPALVGVIKSILGEAITLDALYWLNSQWWFRVFFMPAGMPGLAIFQAGDLGTSASGRYVEAKPDAEGRWSADVPPPKGPVKIQVMLPNGKSFPLKFGAKGATRFNAKSGTTYDLGRLTPDRKNGLKVSIEPPADLVQDPAGKETIEAGELTFE